MTEALKNIELLFVVAVHSTPIINIMLMLPLVILQWVPPFFSYRGNQLMNFKYQDFVYTHNRNNRFEIEPHCKKDFSYAHAPSKTFVSK